MICVYCPIFRIIVSYHKPLRSTWILAKRLQAAEVVKSTAIHICTRGQSRKIHGPGLLEEPRNDDLKHILTSVKPPMYLVVRNRVARDTCSTNDMPAEWSVGVQNRYSDLTSLGAGLQQTNPFIDSRQFQLDYSCTDINIRSMCCSGLFGALVR